MEQIDGLTKQQKKPDVSESNAERVVIGKNFIKTLVFKFNNKRTKKEFTHTNDSGDLMFTVATPEDFYEWAGKLQFNVFRMACLQSYVQLDDGKWRKGVVCPFENSKSMLDSGIKRISL